MRKIQLANEKGNKLSQHVLLEVKLALRKVGLN